MAAAVYGGFDDDGTGRTLIHCERDTHDDKEESSDNYGTTWECNRHHLEGKGEVWEVNGNPHVI